MKEWRTLRINHQDRGRSDNFEDAGEAMEDAAEAAEDEAEDAKDAMTN